MQLQEADTGNNNIHVVFLFTISLATSGREVEGSERKLINIEPLTVIRTRSQNRRKSNIHRIGSRYSHETESYCSYWTVNLQINYEFAKVCVVIVLCGLVGGRRSSGCYPVTNNTEHTRAMLLVRTSEGYSWLVWR